MDQTAQASAVITGALSKNPLFAGLSDTAIATLLGFTRQRWLTGSEVLFRESEPCAAFYLVVEGSIKLYRVVANGQERPIEFVCAPNIFGEAAMFSGGGYPFSAVAVRDSELLEFDGYRFSRYMRSQQMVTWKMLANLSQRVHQLVDRLENLSGHSVEEKVADFLLRHLDSDSAEGSIRCAPTRHKDLAAMLGIKPETFCRTLRIFRERGWIVKEQGSLRVVDDRALRDLLSEK